MPIQTVGVIGAGQMGNGIAHVFAVAGYDVLLNDISEEAVSAALALIGKNLARQVAKGNLSQADADAALSRIRHEPVLSTLGQTDLIIEAATDTICCGDTSM